MFGKKKNEKKTIDQEVKVSWRNIARRWGENLKDDVDPVITGSKMGVYGLHAIPTWSREYKEGKMRSDKPFLSGLMACIVGATEAAAYHVGAMQFNAQMDSELGYVAAGGALIASNIGSWGYEALRKARKDEHGKVYMTRIQRTIDEPSGEFDLTNQDLAQEVNKRMQKETREWRRDRDYDPELADENLEEITKQTREAIGKDAYGVFQGLFTEKLVGSKYQMTTGLKVGPGPRSGSYHSETNGSKHIREIIYETVEANGGKANIELFGEMSFVFDGEKNTNTHYSVKPNKLWK